MLHVLHCLLYGLSHLAVARNNCILQVLQPLVDLGQNGLQLQVEWILYGGKGFLRPLQEMTGTRQTGIADAARLERMGIPP